MRSREEGLPGEYANAPDRALMAAIKAGRVDAFEVLVDRHWAGVLGYSTRMLGSVDAAEDIAQEVFVAVWEHRERWSPHGSVRGFLYRVARNRGLHRTKHQEVRDQSEHEIRAQANSVPTPEEHVVWVQRREAMERVLAELPDRRREAFILVRIHGFSLPEAADFMGVTRRTVTNHLYMATRALEDALRPVDG